MKKTALVFIAVMNGGMLCGQNFVFQQAGAISVASGGFGGPGIVTAAPAGARSIAGSPFSGTEQRHSLQVLGDGTRIERNDTTQISRDSQGRTRMEMPAGPDGRSMVTIQDPVAGAVYMLDPVQKTVSRIPLPKRMTEDAMKGATKTAVKEAVSFSVAEAGVLAGASTTGAANAQIVINGVPSVKGGDAPEEEDLGSQNINGVVAKGTRSTINVPVGQIGNDRAIQVVNERWYSDDLQMVVKSSNSDPRFGTTTYELTNISRAEPDPSLFQAPADYTVQESRPPVPTIQTK